MPFAYNQPPDLGAALAALAEEGALPIAGGTSLVPRIRRREVAPRLLVSISRVPELRGVWLDSGSLAVGSATTLSEVARSSEVAVVSPLLQDLCAHVRSPQIRNAATLAGCLLSGPDFAEPALALVALGARATLRSRDGEREVAVEELVAEDGALRQGELIVGVTIPSAPETHFGQYRVARREAIEPPLVAAAVCLRLDSGGTAESVRVCLGVATRWPLRLRRAEELLRGSVVSPETARQAAEAALAEVPLRPDVRASEGYRRRVAATAVARSVEAALGRSR